MWYILDCSVRNIHHIKADFSSKWSVGMASRVLCIGEISSSCRAKRMHLYAQKLILINVCLAVTTIAR